MGAQQYASGVGDVWRLASEGRGDLLLVEEDFHYPGRLDEASGQLLPADNAAEPGVMDDAVDELLEAVLAKNCIVIHSVISRSERGAGGGGRSAGTGAYT